MNQQNQPPAEQPKSLGEENMAAEQEHFKPDYASQVNITDQRTAGTAGEESSTLQDNFEPVDDSVRPKTNTALEDTSYDVISILYHKAKAINVYEKYLQDMHGETQLRHVLLQIRHDEQRHIEQLKNHLARLLAQKTASSEGTTMPGD